MKKPFILALALAVLISATSGLGTLSSSARPRFGGCTAAADVTSPNQKICIGGEATLTASLVGVPPFRVTWSDGVTQTGLTGPTVTRTVSPLTTTTYSIAAMTDATCIGTESGKTKVMVESLLTAFDVNSTPEPSFPVTNGSVFVAVERDGVLYLGGNFTGIGLYAGAAAPLDATGEPAPSFPRIEGTVNACVADGSGGWYLGGSFTSVGDYAIANLAHVNSDLTVDTSFVPDPDNQILALSVAPGTLYAGGEFASIGGQPRDRIAALNATGLATAWDPGADGAVLTLAVDGAKVYAGGNFVNIGGASRSHIAALDTTTGLATPWDPDADDAVRVLAVAGTTVYAGGDFISIGEASRNRIAALDATTGLATGWDPDAGSGGVRALAVNGGVVYVGGSFTSIGLQERNNIAAIDAGTGLATAWKPDASDAVLALVVSGSIVYAGGQFTTIGEQLRNRLAALDTTTGLATDWDPSASGSVNALAVSGGTVYAGGTFSRLREKLRNHVAAVDASTGRVTAWNPNADEAVFAIAATDDVIYLGGTFEKIGGQARLRIAAVDTGLGQLTPWNPTANHAVFALTVSGATVYAGGQFTVIGGQPRNFIAALDATTGVATAWDANANDAVNALLVNGPTVYAGGRFTTIGGLPRNFIAALDAGTGAATPWNPSADDLVFTFEVSGTVVYAGGQFTTIGGQTRKFVAALDATTGLASAWDAEVGGPVFGLAARSGEVYLGGAFTDAGGQLRNHLAAVDAVTGLATTWNPNADAAVLAMAVSDAEVYAGGDSTSIGGHPRPGLAAFRRSPRPVTGLIATAGEAGTVNLTWDALGGATTYRAYRSAVTGGPYETLVGETSTTSLTDATPLCGDNYYVVRSYDAGCQSPLSDEASVNLAPGTVAPVLDAPDTSGNNIVVLTWTPTAFTDQHVLRSTSDGPEVEIAATTGSTYTDTTVAPGVSYTYRLRVDAPMFCSGYSNAVVAIPGGVCLAPPSFGGLVSVASSGTTPCGLVLTWAAATPQCVGGGPVTYTIYRSPFASFTPSGINRIALGVTATTFTDTGNLSPAGTYYYIVRAVDTSNHAEDTNTVRWSGTPSGCTASAPNAVPAFTATSGDGRVQLTWVNPLAGQYGGTHVLVRTDGTFPISATDPAATIVTVQFGAQGQADSFVHDGLVNGTTYSYAAFVDNGFVQFSARATCSALPQALSTGVEWVYNAGASALAPVGIYAPSSPTDVGTAYMVANDRMLHAANADVETAGGGSWPETWLPLSMNGPSQARPTIVDATLGIGIPRTAFVSSQDGYVYCVNAATGQTLWTSPQLGDAVQAEPVGIFQAYGASFDLVVVGVRNSTSGSKLYGLRVSNGTIAWAFDNAIEQGGDGLSMGIISSGASIEYGSPARAYFTSRTRGGGSQGSVWCVEFTETSVTSVWSRSIGDVDSAAIPYNGRLYVGTNGGSVYALDAATGADAWAAPVALSDGSVKGYVFPDFFSNRLFVSTTTKVWALTENGATGAVAWSTTVATNPSAPLVRFGTPYLYVGGSDGKLHQIVSATGAPGNPAVLLGSGPAVVGVPSYDVASGLIYVGTDAGRIYAVRPPAP